MGIRQLVGSVHELNPSIWVAEGSEQAFPALDGDRHTDVVVVGAGITGLTLARMLVDAGAGVVVVDAGPVCAGATGYTTAKVTALHRLIYRELIERHGEERAAAYAAANQSAVERVAAFVEVDGIDCDLERAPAVTYTGRDEHVVEIEGEVEAARRLGLPAERTTTLPLPYPVKAAIRLDHQLHFHPRRYCLALARQVVERGGSVHEHTRALEVDTRSTGVVVATAGGRISAERAVLATHLPFADRGGFFSRAHPYRSYAMAARLRDAAPDGMYISVEEPTRSLRPARDGRMIFGGEGHRTGEETDTVRHYAALESWAKQNFDVASIDYRWSAQDYETVDGLPYVGQLTAREERVLVATGFRKWGMTNGTAAAQILADRILGRDNDWAAAFDATRIAPRPSVTSFLRENFTVARHFVADRVAALRATPAATLDPGQGAIARYNGTRAACYRDQEGSLHAVSPVCTHLRCQVTFNDAERTWDCPCHGSRFDVDGHVLEGPAVKDLPPKTASAPPNPPEE
jgi:glycine/D-amino acid oxidase-like deaminating enzyme/nitrite reductase/ring-hydroxylating ferredoxin subunit